MTELMARVENKDGILVVSSRVIAEHFNKEHKNVIRDLENILESSNVSSLIISSFYEVEGQSRKYKEYLLTEKGFTLYMFNIQGHNDFKMAYINEFERMKNALNTQMRVPTNFKEALLLALEQQEIIEKQQEELIHKEDVIIGLVEDIDLSTKRQRITQIVRHNSKNYQDRYNLLYQEFEKKYHCDLRARLENYNSKNKPKLKNKMDYIDKIMNKIPQLYEICCKIFENDLESLKKDWFDVIEDNEVI